MPDPKGAPREAKNPRGNGLGDLKSLMAAQGMDFTPSPSDTAKETLVRQFDDISLVKGRSWWEISIAVEKAKELAKEAGAAGCAELLDSYIYNPKSPPNDLSLPRLSAIASILIPQCDDSGIRDILTRSEALLCRVHAGQRQPLYRAIADFYRSHSREPIDLATIRATHSLEPIYSLHSVVLVTALVASAEGNTARNIAFNLIVRDERLRREYLSTSKQPKPLYDYLERAAETTCNELASNFGYGSAASPAENEATKQLAFRLIRRASPQQVLQLTLRFAEQLEPVKSGREMSLLTTYRELSKKSSSPALTRATEEVSLCVAVLREGLKRCKAEDAQEARIQDLLKKVEAATPSLSRRVMDDFRNRFHIPSRGEGRSLERRDIGSEAQAFARRLFQELSPTPQDLVQIIDDAIVAQSAPGLGAPPMIEALSPLIALCVERLAGTTELPQLAVRLAASTPNYLSRYSEAVSLQSTRRQLGEGFDWSQFPEDDADDDAEAEIRADRKRWRREHRALTTSLGLTLFALDQCLDRCALPEALKTGQERLITGLGALTDLQFDTLRDSLLDRFSSVITPEAALLMYVKDQDQPPAVLAKVVAGVRAFTLPPMTDESSRHTAAFRLGWLLTVEDQGIQALAWDKLTEIFAACLADDVLQLARDFNIIEKDGFKDIAGCQTIPSRFVGQHDLRTLARAVVFIDGVLARTDIGEALTPLVVESIRLNLRELGSESRAENRFPELSAELKLLTDRIRRINDTALVRQTLAGIGANHSLTSAGGRGDPAEERWRDEVVIWMLNLFALLPETEPLMIHIHVIDKTGVTLTPESLFRGAGSSASAPAKRVLDKVNRERQVYKAAFDILSKLAKDHTLYYAVLKPDDTQSSSEREAREIRSEIFKLGIDDIVYILNGALAIAPTILDERDPYAHSLAHDLKVPDLILRIAFTGGINSDGDFEHLRLPPLALKRLRAVIVPALQHPIRTEQDRDHPRQAFSLRQLGRLSLRTDGTQSQPILREDLALFERFAASSAEDIRIAAIEGIGAALCGLPEAEWLPTIERNLRRSDIQPSTTSFASAILSLVAKAKKPETKEALVILLTERSSDPEIAGRLVLTDTVSALSSCDKPTREMVAPILYRKLIAGEDLESEERTGAIASLACSLPLKEFVAICVSTSRVSADAMGREFQIPVMLMQSITKNMSREQRQACWGAYVDLLDQALASETFNLESGRVEPEILIEFFATAVRDVDESVARELAPRLTRLLNGEIPGVDSKEKLEVDIRNIMSAL